MKSLAYKPYTEQEAAIALAISDCDAMTGKDIARDLLAGVIEFEDNELDRLAVFKGVTVDYMIEHDPAFRRYSDPRKDIAVKLLRSGADAEYAAEICGLSVDLVKELTNHK